MRTQIEITPEMMAACEGYYANWQRIQGIHDPDQLKADCWSATHAMRAMLAAAPAEAGEPVGEVIGWLHTPKNPAVIWKGPLPIGTKLYAAPVSAVPEGGDTNV